MNAVDPQNFSITIDNDLHVAAGTRRIRAVVTITAGGIPDVPAEVALRLWIPAGATVVSFDQVAPTSDELTGRGQDAGRQLIDFLVYPWGGETRTYRIELDVDPAPAGRKKLAARLLVMVGDAVRAQGEIPAIWAADQTPSPGLGPEGGELWRAISEGLAAHHQGDTPVATARLKRALDLAERSADRATADLLRRIVDVDRDNGTARLRPAVTPDDRNALEALSSRTSRVRKET